jgi:hypothetical protein
MFFFSGLLFTFELMEIKRVEAIDFFYRRNFGFLYNILGRALFVILWVNPHTGFASGYFIFWYFYPCLCIFSIAFLSFGLGDPQALSYGTGVAVGGFGVFEIALYLKYPEVFESLEKQQQT